MSSTTTEERFRGSMLGLALGDAIGAPFEGGIIERLAWRCISLGTMTKLRWTDDTQMSLDTAESLAAKGRVDPDDLAQRFANSYRWSRGYGPGAARLLKRIRRGADWREANRSVYPNGSYGNGAAMRAPITGLFCYAQPDAMVEETRDAACITHAHPLGIEGAVIIASATCAAVSGSGATEILQKAGAQCTSESFERRFETAANWLESGLAPDAMEVRSSLGNGIAAVESCITALYIASRFLNDSLEQMLAFVAACRGDVDTIGAMAGGIWGASNGVHRLPADKLDLLEQRDRIDAAAIALCSVLSEHRNRNGRKSS